MNTATRADLGQLISHVQELLDAKKEAFGTDLGVSQDELRQDGDWTYLVVSPRRPGIRAYDYARVLTEVERELRAEGIDHVILLVTLED